METLGFVYTIWPNLDNYTFLINLILKIYGKFYEFILIFSFYKFYDFDQKRSGFFNE